MLETGLVSWSELPSSRNSYKYRHSSSWQHEQGFRSCRKLRETRQWKVFQCSFGRCRTKNLTATTQLTTQHNEDAFCIHFVLQIKRNPRGVGIWISCEPARCMWLLIVLCLIVLCSINSRDSNEERCAFATSFSHPFLLLVLNSTRGMIGMSMVLSCGILVFLSSLARAACVLGVYVSSCRQIFFAWMSLHGLSDSKIMLSFGNRIWRRETTIKARVQLQKFP